MRMRTCVVATVLVMLTGAPVLGAACVVSCLPGGDAHASHTDHATHHGHGAVSRAAGEVGHAGVDLQRPLPPATMHDCERQHPAHRGPVLSPPAGRGEAGTRLTAASAEASRVPGTSIARVGGHAAHATWHPAPPGPSYRLPLVLRI